MQVFDITTATQKYSIYHMLGAIFHRWGTNRVGESMRVTYFRNILIMLLSLTWIINTASASEEDNYFGIQYSSVTYEDTSLGETLEFKPGALVARMGTFVNDYLAIDGRLGFGLSDDSASMSGTAPPLGDFSASFGYDIKNLFGIYALGNFPLTSRLDIYGLIGYSSIDAGVKVDLTSGSFGGSVAGGETENGLSYGFGARIGIGNNASLNLEYMSYLDKDEFVVESLNAGVLFNY